MSSGGSNELMTLLSVVVGGIITYTSTHLTERRKYKRSVEKEKLEEILIPCCTILEEVIGEIKDIESINKYSENNKIDKMYFKLEKPLVYLKAVNRIYLSKESKRLLEKYKDEVVCFKECLKKEQEIIINSYKAFIGSKLISFQCMNNIDISLKEEFKEPFKLALLNKLQFSLLNYIDSALFYDGDIENNYENNYMFINITQESNEKYEMIEQGYLDESNLSQDEYLNYNFLWFFHNNITTKEETLFLQQLIENSESKGKLNILNATLINLEKCILSEIDSIVK